MCLDPVYYYIMLTVKFKTFVTFHFSCDEKKNFSQRKVQFAATIATIWWTKVQCVLTNCWCIICVTF